MSYVGINISHDGRGIEMAEAQSLLTVTQAASALGISTRAVRHAVERGTLAAVPVGALWLITRDAIIAYERDHRHRPGQSLRDNPPATPAAKPTRKRAATDG